MNLIVIRQKVSRQKRRCGPRRYPPLSLISRIFICDVINDWSEWISSSFDKKWVDENGPRRYPPSDAVGAQGHPSVSPFQIWCSHSLAPSLFFLDSNNGWGGEWVRSSDEYHFYQTLTFRTYFLTVFVQCCFKKWGDPFLIDIGSFYIQIEYRLLTFWKSF